MNRVRIQRSRKSDARMMVGWMNVLVMFLNWILRPYIDQQKSALQELKYQELQSRITANTERAKKQANDVVIGDLKIEKLVMENELLKAKLKAHGIGAGEFAPPSDYGPNVPK